MVKELLTSGRVALGRAKGAVRSQRGPGRSVPRFPRPTSQQFPVFVHSIAVPTDVDDVAAVEQAVDQLRRHYFIPQLAAHSLNPLFDVRIVDARSWRALINSKKNAAPSRTAGR